MAPESFAQPQLLPPRPKAKAENKKKQKKKNLIGFHTSNYTAVGGFQPWVNGRRLIRGALREHVVVAVGKVGEAAVDGSPSNTKFNKRRRSYHSHQPMGQDSTLIAGLWTTSDVF